MPGRCRISSTIPSLPISIWACATARVKENLSWNQWTDRLQEYLERAEFLLWPDLIIIGGGISHDAGQFIPLLNIETPVVAAELQNNSGIVGIARASAQRALASV